MTVTLGADTICWHARLEQGTTTPEAILEECATLEARCLQVGLYYVQALKTERLEALAVQAANLGIALRASGGSLGSAARGDKVEDAVERVTAALHRAEALGSPYLRLFSGFYRSDLAGDPGMIERERRQVVEVLESVADLAARLGIRLLLENHADFSADEYASIVESIGLHRTGIFLDFMNSIGSLEDPAPLIDRLGPLADAGHVKDYRLHSLMVPDGHHRRGFEVQWVYPGEGAAPLDQLVPRLLAAVGERDFFLIVEGLDNGEASDQVDRIGKSFARLRAAMNGGNRR